MKINLLKGLLRSQTAILIAVFLCPNAQSAMYYFQGISGGSLGTAANWTTNPTTFVAGAVLPTAADDVVFNVASANNTTNSPTIYYSLALVNRIYNSITCNFNYRIKKPYNQME